ncbi:MAG: tetratricopeptide repeat protein, partial [Longimicrobiales bacterium]
MAGRYHDEIEKLQALYAENPDGRVFTHLAEAYRKAGELDRAKEVLDGGLRRHSDYSSAHVVMGRVLADRGDMHAAAASFRRVLQLDPHNLVALRALGDLARRADRPDEAAGYYREILAMDPGDEELAEYVSRHEAMTGARAAQTRVPPPVEVGDPGVQNIGFEPGDAGLVDIGDISVGGDEGWAMLDLDIGNLSLGGAEAGSMAGREAEAGAPADASAAARSSA